MNNTELQKQLQIIKKATEQALSLLGAEEEVSDVKVRPVAPTVTDTTEIEIDFSMPSRAFFKKYTKGLSSPKIFVLMVAYFVNQNGSEVVALSDIQKEWSKITGIVKYKFATTFAMRAKENDWLSSPKNSFYSLRPKWKDIFK